MSNQIIIKQDVETELEIEKKKYEKLKEVKKETLGLKPLIETPSATKSSCVHESETPSLAKVGKDVNTVRFDFTHIDNLLSNMNTPQEKIRWLKTYLKQLRQSQRTMYLTAKGLPALRTVEEQYNALSPYAQIYPLIINKIQNKIRRLRQEVWQRK